MKLTTEYIISMKGCAVLLLLVFANLLYSQQPITLDQILTQVVDHSYAATRANNQKEGATYAYEFFQSQMKPTIGLRASLPDYSKTSSAVVQPDGSIAFQSIRQGNSAISAYASQVLPSTGGTLFLNSDLQRFDDFSLKANQYNGIPIRLGISQPLIGYNPWKYEKNIQSLLYEESLIAFNIDVEESMGIATDLYFNILIANQNLEIAKTNQLVNEKLLNITEERLLLGKVSKDEKLQLEIELNNAKLSVSQASTQLQQAIASLYTFLSIDIPNSVMDFQVPDILALDVIDEKLLLEEYKTNRPEIIAYQRQLKENAQDLAKAKADYGFRADLQASIGLARGADNLNDIYTNPFNEQQFNLSVTVPILDWGKKSSAMNQVKLQKKSVEDEYKQQILVLENNIRQLAYQFTSLQSDMVILKSIMEKADERFSISNDRYVLGNIDITNLTLAQREKDQTKRNYINALKSYWVTYYQLRLLSGYDIINNKKITYQ